MRIFYSGNLSGESLPEILIAKDKPFIMLTYYELHEGNKGTRNRFKKLRELRRGKGK